jgi:hypothetical protein
MLEQMREELKETKEANRRLMEKVLDSKADPIGQIHNTMDLIERLRNPEAERPKTLTERLGDRAIELMPLVAQGVMQYIGKGQGQAPGPFMGQQQPQLTPVAEMPIAQPAPAPQPQQLDRMGQLKQVVIQYGPVIAQQINSRVRGCDFAANLEGVFGKTIWGQIAGYQPEEIVSTLNEVVTFRQSVSSFSDAELRQWVEEFLRYEEILDKEEVAS